jgi:hypothetical protein
VTLRSFLRYFEKINQRTMNIVGAIPPGKVDWGFHPDKFTLGDLVRHIAASNRGLPFVKKTVLTLLTTEYKRGEEAAQKIPAELAQFYADKYAEIARTRNADIEPAGRSIAGIYERNVFPDLKVTWGTYPNNLGHVDFPRCFRCHDDSHASAVISVRSQDTAFKEMYGSL